MCKDPWMGSPFMDGESRATYVLIVPFTTEDGAAPTGGRCPTAQSPSNTYKILYNNQLLIDVFPKKMCS